jgi:hypothetical protein
MDEMIAWLQKRIKLLSDSDHDVWIGAHLEAKRALAEAQRIVKRQERRERKAS